MLVNGRVSCDIDLDAEGVHHGFLDLEHSTNELAFASVRVPISVINNGTGPSVLLTGGNHGDEYEGQLICRHLLRQLARGDIRGRLIVMPGLNMPAVVDRARVSPHDGGNMNRSFPGHARGAPTEAIAAFVVDQLLPRLDMVLDFHSGGTSARFVDCGFLSLGADTRLNARNIELASAFAAPFTVVCPLDGSGGDFDTAAHKAGVAFLACELGGAGAVSAASFDCGLHGALRVLSHLGLVGADVPARLSPRRPAMPSTFLDFGAGSRPLVAMQHGLVHPLVDLGVSVRAGDKLAELNDLYQLDHAPRALLSPIDGVVAVARRNPLVAPGDFVYLVMPVLPPPHA